MRTLRLLTSLIGLFPVIGRARADGFSGRPIDLTHAYDESTIYWPTEGGFVLTPEHAGKTEQGYYYTSNTLCTPEHGGTHIDAPIHFAEGHRTVDRIPLEQLMGEAVLVDVSAAAAKDRDHRIEIEDVRAWERKNGPIPLGAIVLFRTGFGRSWPDRTRYLGTNERGAAAIAKLHFPGLGAETAAWLVRERRVKAVGIDTASIDRGQSTQFETHRALFAADVPALENLANLELLPERGFSLIALPMKIAGGSGGPVRAVAFVR